MEEGEEEEEEHTCLLQEVDKLRAEAEQVNQRGESITDLCCDVGPFRHFSADQVKVEEVEEKILHSLCSVSTKCSLQTKLISKSVFSQNSCCS